MAHIGKDGPRLFRRDLGYRFLNGAYCYPPKFVRRQFAEITPIPTIRLETAVIISDEGTFDEGTGIIKWEYSSLNPVTPGIAVRFEIELDFTDEWGWYQQIVSLSGTDIVRTRRRPLSVGSCTFNTTAQVEYLNGYMGPVTGWATSQRGALWAEL